MESREEVKFHDIYSKYKGRGAKKFHAVPREYLEVGGHESLKTKLKDVARRALVLYKAVKLLPDDAISVERGELQTNVVPLIAEQVEDSIPLKFSVVKVFSHNTITGKDKDELHFDLVKGEGRAGQIGNMHFNVTEDGFELFDRFVNEKYRGRNGFGSMLLGASEAYMQEAATDSQHEKIFSAGTVQLDVMCWLYKNGCDPDDADMWEKIKEGDSELCLGEEYCVFPVSVPENERTFRNRDNTINPIKFSRKIMPKKSADVEGVRGQVVKKLGEI